ncbi:MAG: hypothetical protein PHX44_01130 [Sulfurimonas sp.]|uniref:hypothetical protein n=1 Tax=Sulfurimonas sp. TaxID=2022749 RepID=UPI0026072006|nr:hypothetical protein [Sulfurimonas sp.]MDD2651636.1 hypothetical protein [Sulfurimonas sp.]MDD3451447.1 hypothetical protein [Sulfurimonas sp.]
MDIEIFKLSVMLVFSLLLLYFSLLKKGEKFSMRVVAFIFIGSFLFITILSSLIALYENSDAKDKIKAFYDKKTVLCKAGALGIKHNYLVLENEGWSVYDDRFFKKDDLLLEIINCEVKESR